jgi:formylglycine-generating enzyme required for sulfatase activity
MKRVAGARFGIALIPVAWLACGLDVVGGAPSADVLDASSDAGARADTGLPEPGDAGAPVDAGCPELPGPVMVRVGSYCIDSTEVTEAQYAAFVNAAPRIDAGVSCAWNKELEPDTVPACRWDPAKFPNLPVTCVDWCDAYSYCLWAGKRLCGAIDGGPIAWARGDDTNPAKDQWYQACSRGGELVYPYGDLFDAGACNGSEKNVLKVLDAGSLPTCAGGYPGLFDMVGSAFEWEDSCDGVGGATDVCKNRGGSWFWGDITYNSCAGTGLGDSRGDRYPDVGFRCCSP